MARTRRRIQLVLAVLLVVGLIAWLVSDWWPTDQTAEPLSRASMPGEGLSSPVLLGNPVGVRDAPSREPATPQEEADTPPLKGAYVLEGIVRDIETKEVITGAEVIGTWTRVIPKAKHSYSLESIEVRADVLDGDRFRLEVEGDPPPPLTALRVADKDWQVIRLERLGPTGEQAEFSLRLREGTVEHLTVWVRRVFFIRGKVQDSRGNPLQRARVSFVVPTLRQSGSIAMGGTSVYSDQDGQYEIGPFAYHPRMGIPDTTWEYLRDSLPVVFRHDGFATHRVDPLDVPTDQRAWYVVTLSRGVNLAGIALDPWGQPLADVPVVAEYGTAWDLRRGVRTDADGRWRLENLTPGEATLCVRAFARDLRAKREMTIAEDDNDIELITESIVLKATPSTTDVLGLGLAEVTDELRHAYDIPEFVHVVILDPGADPTRLGIGRLEKGYGIYMVGHEKVSTVRRVVELLIEVSSARDSNTRGRVVYTFWNERMAGTNTQHVRLTAEHVEGLKRVLDGLSPPLDVMDDDAR